MIRTKILKSKTTKRNSVVYIEKRYDETGIYLGLFFIEEKNGKRIEEVEMPFICTANDIFDATE